ncbi:hypothetical protein [Bacillus badius]|uniref:Yip1 domain-containing protein n=1 Tax=Bacillus badius TaxID=1455 RepID=A0ABR5AUU5_BACBA|nr:hypothetical protein [Bacillus badius]KIL76400.1 hypothetical protein SD78_0502 [Bacillus badius]KIL78516.1 hypothetical protein SD77_4196 [Bacillus badius]KZR58710.1 hypothetical protein A3781_15980 [Bacillus badius]MED4715944.1 hypothetical protein [Bacillus badius]
MVYRVQLIKGLFQPSNHFYQLNHAEQIKGLWSRLSLLIIISTALYCLSGLLGIHSEPVSAYFAAGSNADIQGQKLWFAMGSTIWGLLYPLIILFLPALLFWVFLEVDFRKLLVLQSFVYVIYLIEFCLLILLNVTLAIPRDSSPFSLGVLAQYATKNELVTSFFSFITLFQAWAISLQYKFLKQGTERSPKFVLVLILVITLALWLFSTLFTSIQVDRLF